MGEELLGWILGRGSIRFRFVLSSLMPGCLDEYMYIGMFSSFSLSAAKGFENIQLVT